MDPNTNAGLPQMPPQPQTSASPEPLPAQPQPIMSTMPTVEPTQPVAFAPPAAPVSTPMQPPQPMMGAMPTEPIAYQQPMAVPMPVKKSSKMPLIIGIVLLVVILGGGAAYALLSAKPKKSSDSSNTTNNSSNNKPTVSANAKTATTLYDYGDVCSGTVTISNATDYATGAKPHKIALFKLGIDGETYSSSSVYLKDTTWAADSKAVGDVQLVGCFSRKTGTETKVKACQLQDSSKKTVSIDMFSVVYNLKIYEAKTGKLLSTKDVSGPASTCPYIVSYDPADPKIYGSEDTGSTTEAIREFVTK